MQSLLPFLLTTPQQGNLIPTTPVQLTFLPASRFTTTISTDLNHRCLKDRTFSLPVNMSKFMVLGLDLKQVVAMATINPACAIHEESRIGSLKPGMAADVSILELKSGAWTLIDTPGETLKTDKLLMPIAAVKDGKVIKAEPVALPPSAS